MTYTQEKQLFTFFLIAAFASGCDGNANSWIFVTPRKPGITSELWPAISRDAKLLGMVCEEGLGFGSSMYSSLRPPIRSELFCSWTKKKRKMRLYAAYSDQDLLVYTPWYTTELWPSSTEGQTLIRGLEDHFRKEAPEAQIKICIDDCDTPFLDQASR